MLGVSADDKHCVTVDGEMVVGRRLRHQAGVHVAAHVVFLFSAPSNMLDMSSAVVHERSFTCKGPVFSPVGCVVLCTDNRDLSCPEISYDKVTHSPWRTRAWIGLIGDHRRRAQQMAGMRDLSDRDRST